MTHETSVGIVFYDVRSLVDEKFAFLIPLFAMESRLRGITTQEEKLKIAWQLDKLE